MDIDTATRTAWAERGYDIDADGRITKQGATILEAGTRVLIKGTAYTGSIIGGDFCAGTEYVLAMDFTGTIGCHLSRQTNRADSLLTGAAAIEDLQRSAEHARSKRFAGIGVPEEFEAAIERLADDADTAREKSLRGGYYRR